MKNVYKCVLMTLCWCMLFVLLLVRVSSFDALSALQGCCFISAIVIVMLSTSIRARYYGYLVVSLVDMAVSVYVLLGTGNPVHGLVLGGAMLLLSAVCFYVVLKGVHNA